MSDHIERRIVTGMITSKRFLDEISKIYKSRYLQSDSARLLAEWCLEYHKTYSKAPKEFIVDIYHKKLKNGLQGRSLEHLEAILNGLSDDYSPEQTNIDYLLDETEAYFKKQSLIELSDEIREQAESGDNLEAETALSKYQIIQRETGKAVNPLEPEPALIRQAFEQQAEPLIKFNGKMGEFANESFTRESLVGFMGPEKIGKTFMLIECAIKAMRTGSNVVFFEAGDMTQAQLIRRMGIYHTKRSDLKRYCGKMLIPVLDCLKNQRDTCTKKERKCDFGIFEDEKITDIKNMVFEDLAKVHNEESEYRPCRVCEKKKSKAYEGAIWYKERESVDSLTWKEAYKAITKFGKTIKRKFRLYSYPNDTLRAIDIESELAILENQEGWSPDVIIIDYADLMDGPGDSERDKQNRIWKKLRALSQARKCLVLTATQADAASYGKETLTRRNFSEDKRKYGHVTCMFGLQGTFDEKKKGLLRLNKLVLREDSFDEFFSIKIIQCLQIGRPFLGSFF